MRICFVVSNFSARSQTFVLAQVLYAVAQGHAVTVACRDGAANPDLPAETLAALRQVRIVRWPPAPLPGQQALPTALRDRIVQRRATRSWRQQIDADLVIAHFGYAGAAVARAQHGWAARPPLVTVFHGRDVSVERHRDGLAKYRDLFADGDLFVTVNAPFAADLIAGGAPRARVETHHLGVPIARYQMTRPAPVTVPRMVSVARLVPKKGLNVAIDALKQMRDRYPRLDWHYDIGGDGPMEASLRCQVAQAGLNDRVHFLGPLSHAAALDLIGGAQALIVPSVTAEDGDQEGIPVTLMEAMALGTPVCTTRHSGIPELVVHGDSGLLSDEHDAEGLCANMAALALGTVNSDRMARLARSTVECGFDEDRQTAALIARCRTLAEPQSA